MINLSDMRLYDFGEPGAKPRSYPIGIGRDGLTTPLGATEIARMKKDPVWRPTARMRAEDPTLPEVVGPGPDNPMGTRAMYLGLPLYAIHGTNNPWAVGRRSSSGCIRMYPEHAEELYELVEVGTKVTIVDQPIKLEWIDGELFMEAHPTQVQSDELEVAGPFTPELPSRVVDQVLEVAGDAGRAPRLEPDPPGDRRTARLSDSHHPLGRWRPEPELRAPLKSLNPIGRVRPCGRCAAYFRIVCWTIRSWRSMDICAVEAASAASFADAAARSAASAARSAAACAA